LTTFINPNAGTGRGELRFRLAGIPITVQPLFWLTALIMGSNRDSVSILIWVAVVFVSILFHEIGHVIAYRVFGENGRILLYGWGGLAYSDRNTRRPPLQQIVVSLAGPAAGFTFAALVLGVAWWAGAKIQVGLTNLFIPQVYALLIPTDENARQIRFWNIALNDLLWVNVYWGLVNLLPIYPLDGGQASRALFEAQDPARGVRRALYLSIIAAVAIAVMALSDHNYFVLLMFGMFAYSNVQMLARR
jgi:stage IV sporulation protein FB